jgi:hypothetical protein
VNDGMEYTCGRNIIPYKISPEVDFPESSNGHVSNGGDIFRPRDKARHQVEGLFLGLTLWRC